MSFTANQAGGKYEHKLIKAELPREKPNFYFEQLDNNGDAWATAAIKWAYVGNIQDDNAIKSNSAADYLGEGKPINIMQPYITVAFWRRIK